MDRPTILGTALRRATVGMATGGLLAAGLAPACQCRADGWRFWRRSPATTAHAPVPTAPPTEPVSPVSASTSSELETNAEDLFEQTERKGSPPPTRFPRGPAVEAPGAPGDLEGPAASLDENTLPVDLPTAMRLVGVRNLNVLIAQQYVLATTAQQQYAAAQALPNFNAGGNFDMHTGVYQQASGHILNVQRSGLYVGAGANAVAAGSVGIPGLQYNLNIADAYYTNLAANQRTQRSQYQQNALRNDAAAQVATTYFALVEAEAAHAIAVQTVRDAEEVLRVASAFAKTGQGRPADAARAGVELDMRKTNVVAAKAAVKARSAELVELLNLEHSVTLHPTDGHAVPREIVPGVIPLRELICIALYYRPELAAERAAIHAAILELDKANMLPFSPQVIAGASGGLFGGGSDLVASDNPRRFGAPLNQPRFGNFDGRFDSDLVAFWTIRNLGLGNRGLIDAATARLAESQYNQLGVLNRIRAEVAEAYAIAQTRFDQLAVLNQSVKTGDESFADDLKRARGGEGTAIEVLDSLRLSSGARQAYLRAIIQYNQSQYVLYRAIGQPPAQLLVRTVPEIVPSEPIPSK